MAVLSDTVRAAINKSFQEQLSLRRDLLGAVLKTDIAAMVNAIDDWVDANATAFNSAIPQPARGAMTAKQKAEVLKLVVTARYEAT